MMRNWINLIESNMMSEDISDMPAEFAMVARDPWSIEKIENKSQGLISYMLSDCDLQREDSMLASSMIDRNTSDDNMLTMIRLWGTDAIHYYTTAFGIGDKDIPESYKEAAIVNDPENIRRFPEVSDSIKNIAVRADPFVIRYIDNPSEAVQLVAVRTNKSSFGDIKKPTMRVRMAAGIGTHVGNALDKVLGT